MAHKNNKSFPLFKWMRIAFLLAVLAIVVQDMWHSKQARTFSKPLNVVIYPINPENDPKVEHYIKDLSNSQFNNIQPFLQPQAAQLGSKITPKVNVLVAPVIKDVPDEINANSMIGSIIASLKLRWFAYKHDTYVANNKARFFVLFYNPQKHSSLQHSVAQKQGLVGRVLLFADYSSKDSNQVVLTHELLHMLGATDKYNLATGLPILPDGFANPQQQPLYPQQKAEIMGGYIPLNEKQAVTPNNLDETIVGQKTAQEIGWL